ncbi:MAG: molybdopterin molybdotransferase MoeA [Planctomycetes bacterium]|nr:molybdopterin molybdotransferase MoeA [Planctomycetota bacterium]
MLTISEAFDRLLATVAPLAAQTLPLSESLGLTLAEDVVASADSPPFDKALMDGFAVRSEDLVGGSASLAVVDVVTAGRVPSRPVGPGEAVQIMTGAPLPEGADLVVKVEESVPDGTMVRLTTRSTTAGTNILRRGTSVRTGAVVLQCGQKLNGARIGALAELGRARVLVHRRPTVAVLATGDELVPADQQPGPGQIRNSNQSMLVAQVQAAGAIPVPLGIARDNRDDLRSKILEGLKYDALVLSGGVSAGTLDLVPGELTAAGVREVFHKVEMKPGKPVWFGHRNRSDASDAAANHVFGLPGNPVSSMVCFELFVRTAIRRLMGEANVLPQSIPAKLEHDYSARADRPTYHPARLTWSPDGPVVTLVPWHGSSDLCGTVAANGMAFLSGEARQYTAGMMLGTICW